MRWGGAANADKRRRVGIKRRRAGSRRRNGSQPTALSHNKRRGRSIGTISSNVAKGAAGPLRRKASRNRHNVPIARRAAVAANARTRLSAGACVNVPLEATIDAASGEGRRRQTDRSRVQRAPSAAATTAIRGRRKAHPSSVRLWTRPPLRSNTTAKGIRRVSGWAFNNDQWRRASSSAAVAGAGVGGRGDGAHLPLGTCARQ